MSVTIQDDMWEAAKLMAKAQRTAFLMALLEWGFEGAEPKGKPQWLPTFAVSKDRVELSSKRSKAGGARKQKRGAPESDGNFASKQNETRLKANAGFDPDHGADLLQSRNGPWSALDEMRGDEMRGDEMRTPQPPQGDGEAFASFSKRCLDEWNHLTGQSQLALTGDAVMGLRVAFDSGATVDQVAAVIREKAEDWTSADAPSRMRQALRPSVVLGSRLTEYIGALETEVAADEPRILA